MNAHDFVRTDWTVERPQDRPRSYDTSPATIPCGLRATSPTGANPDGSCPEMFFNEFGRDDHHYREHHIGLNEWRPNPLSGRMQKVRPR